MRVALWGFGDYGRKLYRLLNTVWADKYKVVAVFDKAYEVRMEQAGGQVVVESPDKMKARFDAGEFEGVFIAARGALGRYNDMENQAQAWGIPVVTIAAQDDLVAANALDWVVDANLDSVDEGYVLTACNGVYAFLEQNSAQKLLIYHDGAGHIVKDTWFRDDVKWDPIALNVPQRFDEAPRSVIELSGEYCAANRFWGTNYWHFTFEVLDQISAMELAGFTGVYVLQRAPFAPQLLDLLDFDASRVLWIDDLDSMAAYRFEKVYFIRTEDYLFHGNRASVPLLRFAEKIEKKIDVRHGLGTYPRRLFVERVGTRKLVGAQAVLAKYGFATIVPEKLSVEEQIAHFRAADIVMTPHGANSTNSLYMRPGSVFIETFGQGWGYPACVNPLFKKGVHYLSVTGGFDLANAQKDGTADYYIDQTFLEMAIENALCMVGDASS